MAFKHSLTIVVAVLAACALSYPRHHPLHRGKRSMRLCGSMLVDALAAVCESQYFDPNGRTEKRNNYAYEAAADNLQGAYDSSITDFNGFVDPQTALDFLGLQQVMPPRSPRGVADECCRKSCSFHQLLSYCSPNVRRTSGEKKK